MTEFLQQIDIYSFAGISILIFAGFLVGFINTVAGSGTAITYSLFILWGLPVNVANGTIRMGVIMQTLAASLSFRHKGALDVKKAFYLAIPVIVGSIAGAQIAATINKEIMEKFLAIVMLSMIIFLFFNPKRWLLEQREKIARKISFAQIIIFFLIGLYGGFIHIGVGIFLLSAIVINVGYELVKANASKVFIVLLYSPFALAVFIFNDQVHYGMAFISSIGNVLGGIVASHFAIQWGANVLRWFLAIVILLFSIHLLGAF